MPVRIDGDRHYVEMTLMVDATPEQVWRAFASSEGYSTWFTKASVEQREGGKIVFSMGEGMESVATIKAFEPSKRLAYVEEAWMPDAPPCDTEVTIEPRGDKGCLLCMTHIIESDAGDWDGWLEQFEQGWPGFFEVLRLYFAHFDGKPGCGAYGMRNMSSGSREVWASMIDSLGLRNADVGEERTLKAGLSGQRVVIEEIKQDHNKRMVTLRSPEPATTILLGTFMMGDKTVASIATFCYGIDAQARSDASTATWRAWLAELFPESAEGFPMPT